MPLEPWQKAFLEQAEPLTGLTPDESTLVLHAFCFGAKTADGEDFSETAVELLVQGHVLDVALRCLDVGQRRATAREMRAKREQSERPAQDSEPLDPALLQFMLITDSRAKAEVLRDKHLAAQSALVDAIARQAEACVSEDALLTLADAYMHLPTPDEDFGNADSPTEGP